MTYATIRQIWYLNFFRLWLPTNRLAFCVCKQKRFSQLGDSSNSVSDEFFILLLISYSVSFHFRWCRQRGRAQWPWKVSLTRATSSRRSSIGPEPGKFHKIRSIIPAASSSPSPSLIQQIGDILTANERKSHQRVVAWFHSFRKLGLGWAFGFIKLKIR